MFTRIFAIGDLHGSIHPIENFYSRNKNKFNFSPKTDLIICLGDVGTNFFLFKRDKKFKKQLSELPFTYFCIRGNHEARASDVQSTEPEQWYTEPFGKNDSTVLVEKQFPHIKYAADIPAIYNINGYKTLTLPGAYSVDKYYRLQNHWTWFENEQLTQEEMEEGRHLIKENDYNFDLILSHTCPLTYEPTDLFLSQIDQSTVDKTMEHYFQEIEYQTNYRLWLWGHYHEFRVYPYYNNRQCIMLSAGLECINVIECLENPQNYPIKY